MATITKTSNSTWSGVAGWSGGSPADSQDAVVDSVAGAGPFTAGATVNLSSLWIQPSASSPISVTSASFSTVLFTRFTPPSPGNHTLYLAANRGLTLGLQLAFQNTYNGTHSVFIDSGAVLNANCVAVTANTNTIRKYGAGEWLTASTEFSGASSSNIAAWELYAGILATGTSGTTQALGTASIGFYGGTLRVRFSRTFNNTITVNAAGGTLTASSGATATMNNAASGAGTLTIAGVGGVTWNNNISCPLNVTGLLTMGTGNSLTGATITGAGTIAMSSTGTISGDVSSTTITGNYIRAVVGSRTDSGNSTGYPQFPSTPSGGAGTLTISGTWQGSLDTVWSDAINKKSVVVTGQLQGSSFPNSALRLGTEATITQSGASSAIAGTVSLGFGATFALANTASATANLTTVTGPGYPDHYVTADASATSYSGNLSSSDTTGTMYVDVAPTGTLSLTGANQTFSTGAAARRIKKRQAGRIKVTGKLTVSTAPFDVDAGTLEISSISQAAFNAGLNMAANTTLACSSTGAYAAQLSGNLTLNAGSTMKFGAA